MPTRVEKLHPHDIPGRDIFFPQIIADDEGFLLADQIDGSVVVDGKTYGNVTPALSFTGLRELAVKYAGMVTREQHQEALDSHAELALELESKDIQIDNLQGRIDAVDVIESAGFRARKKPGRKPATQEN